MEKLEKGQMAAIEDWLEQNARPLEKAKWALLIGRAGRKDVAAEMVKYQNEDGGFGNALEADILTPESSAIACGEAVFTALSFGLDLSAPWAQKMYGYLCAARQDSPSFWEPVPPSVEDYPHPPWWGYGRDTAFSPNPCAVLAAALVGHGDAAQRALGLEVARRCIEHLKTAETLQDHDLYCLQPLCQALWQLESPLMDAAGEAINRHLLANVCNQPDSWLSYVAQPLDFVDFPASPWAALLADGLETNLDWWVRTLGEDGVWQPNFSWDTDSEAAQTATRQWKGYMAVKRVRILMNFGRVES